MSGNIVEFLGFRDWIEAEEHLRSDWIIVVRFDKLGVPDNRGTFSALIRSTDADVIAVLTDCAWDVNTDLGQPFFSHSGDAISLKLGDKQVQNGIEFEPFTILRDFHTAYENKVEIVQNFVLYHNLYSDCDGYRFLDPVTNDVIVDYASPKYVRVKASYLKDYLAARKMALVRFHDHHRFVKKNVVSILGKDSDHATHRQDDSHYSIYIGKLGMSLEDETFSRLLGKDLVRPYDEPIHEEYKWLSKKPREFASFLIRIDGSEKRIESTCDERVLSNFFVDKGTPNFLTPVYFRQEVLQKYYDNPTRYTASSHSVSFLDLWNIPIAINREGLVHAWLGDLAHLPYEEQLHWKQHNVPPSGGINEEFYKTQILAQFAESKDPVYLLHKARDQLNKNSMNILGFKILSDLSDADAYIAKSIHIPVTNEQEELDDQLIYLSKCLVDALSKSEMENLVAWRASRREESTHISVLKAFLTERLGYPEVMATQTVRPFRSLQALRSQSAAHLKSSEYRQVLEKSEMLRMTGSELCRRLVALLTTSLSDIAKAIAEAH